MRSRRELTDMSTDHIIEALENCVPPRLVRFRPVFCGSERERRMLSLDMSIHDWLMRGVQAEKQIQLKAAVKVHFGQFVKGDEVDDLYYMKRVADRRYGHEDFSADVWSVRPDFKPYHRFFGAFFREDWLVILSKKPRDTLIHDALWHAQIDTVCHLWDELLPFRRRHRGDQLSQYVTSSAEHYDERW
jgi:hypothetical protein